MKGVHTAVEVVVPERKGDSQCVTLPTCYIRKKEVPMLES